LKRRQLPLTFAIARSQSTQFDRHIPETLRAPYRSGRCFPNMHLKRPSTLGFNKSTYGDSL